MTVPTFHPMDRPDSTTDIIGPTKSYSTFFFFFLLFHARQTLEFARPIFFLLSSFAVHGVSNQQQQQPLCWYLKEKSCPEWIERTNERTASSAAAASFLTKLWYKSASVRTHYCCIEFGPSFLPSQTLLILYLRASKDEAFSSPRKIFRGVSGVYSN